MTSTIGHHQIEHERQILATLLLGESAYTELPEEFCGEDFSIVDYRYLFEKLNARFIQQGKPCNKDELASQYPELKETIADVTFAIQPLNGTLTARAEALMMRRIRDRAACEQANSESVRQPDSNNEKAFRFELLNGMEISQMDIPEQSFLIKNLLSEHSVNFLSGEEGCGKSLLAMNLALSIAVGAKKWLTHEIVKQGKVLFLNNELAFSDYARRLKCMSNSLPARGNISNLIVPREVPALSECWETLNNVCELEKPCLIVVDCLYFTHDKDENDSSQMKALMRQFLSLRDKYGLALLLIHHTKKGARHERMHNDQMRGSNVFGGVTDTVLQIRRSANDEKTRFMKPTKFRHVSDESRKCRLLSLNAESLWFKDEGEADEGEHIAAAAPTAEEEIIFGRIFGDQKELSRKDVIERCKPLGYDERTIDRMLKKARENRTLKVPRYGYYSL